jgi:hypothetical protein
MVQLGNRGVVLKPSHLIAYGYEVRLSTGPLFGPVAYVTVVERRV